MRYATQRCTDGTTTMKTALRHGTPWSLELGRFTLDCIGAMRAFREKVGDDQYDYRVEEGRVQLLHSAAVEPRSDWIPADRWLGFLASHWPRKVTPFTRSSSQGELFPLPDLVLCTSPDGWSFHAPGSTDEDIASGDALYLVAATGTPRAGDYYNALRVLSARTGTQP